METLFELLLTSLEPEKKAGDKPLSILPIKRTRHGACKNRRLRLRLPQVARG